MKITLIKASAPGGFQKYKKSRGGLPQNIFSVAAATSPEYEIKMVDESFMPVKYKTDADLIVLMFSTPDAIQGYHHADRFKKQGKTVIFGGLHPSFMYEEALEHGDSVIVGEAEPVWDEVLRDFEYGILRRVYRSSKPYDLINLRPSPTGLLGAEKYDWIWTVTVSRGCPFACEFCTVNKFFHGIQYRPVHEVVEEVMKCGTDYVELKADNLTVNRAYALQLFEALKPLNIKWSTSTDIRLAQDPELLKAAVESGLMYVLVGIETPSEEALKNSRKGFVKPNILKEAVQRFHDHGVILDSSALFGFDSHGPEIFEQTYDFFNDIEVDVCDSVIVVPFPGTSLFERLDSEGRILTRDWSKYDGSHAVFKPENMSDEELEEGAYWFDRMWNSWTRRWTRNRRQVHQLGKENARYLAETF